MKIGLLGGSFNPAHDGHRYVSLEVMKRLGLDGVWWLVSPGNPLKDTKDNADYATRLEKARHVKCHPRIHVSDIEQRFGTRYTIDTLRRLKQKYPEHDFVWIMGADNLAQFHRWKRWQDIARLMPLIVVDRKPYTRAALASPAAKNLTRTPAPTATKTRANGGFSYLFITPHSLSASFLRKTLGKKAFSWHNEGVEETGGQALQPPPDSSAGNRA